MDKLKEYLGHHKADLDVDSPASDTWEYIGSKIPDESHQTGLPGKSGFSTWVVRYAAAACVIALAGAGVWVVKKREAAPGKEKIESRVREEGKTVREDGKTLREDGKTVLEEGKTPGNDMVRNTSKPKQARRKVRSQKPAELSDEIGIIDKSYSSLIDYQLRKLRATPLYAENGSYFSFYVEQFKQMDQDEQAVRNDIKTYGLTGEFLEQLINVYQQKLNVLKDLQTEVNKMNNKVREKQAPSEKAEVHYLNI
jgi:hypothetical protein